MCIYLIHFPIIYYLMWWVHNRGRSVQWPTDFSCQHSAADYDTCQADLDAFSASRTLPFWLIPVVVALTLPLAAATHRWVEEPCRKAMKHNNNSSNEGEAVSMVIRDSYSNKVEDKVTLLASMDDELK
jgi:peptidoglycan/LPS O-acetylase OafA/YrhL